jgi:tight adherence protein C
MTAGTGLFAGLGAGAVVLLLAAAALLRALGRQERVAARLRFAQGRAGIARRPPEGGALLRAVTGLGAALARSGLLSQRTVAGLQQTLRAAGFRDEGALGLFVGGKVLLLVLLPLAAWVALDTLAVEGPTYNAAIAAAAVAGLLAPDLVAGRLRKRYLKTVERGMPDALDLMVICAEAGLALEASVTRVGTEMGFANAAVANELSTTANELRIMTDRRAALLGLGERTGVESLRRLAVTLVQTLQYGTPLAQALRTLAAEMRQQQLIEFEARAARLPSLLTVPMIMFILPTVFLVVAGPAILQAVRLM